MHLTTFLVTAVVSYLTQLIESSDSDPRSNGFYAHFLFYKIEILRRSFVLHTTTGLSVSQHNKSSKQTENDEQLISTNIEGNCRSSALRKFSQIAIRVQHNTGSTHPTDITWSTVLNPSQVFTLHKTNTISCTRPFMFSFVSIIHFIYTRWRKLTALHCLGLFFVLAIFFTIKNLGLFLYLQFFFTIKKYWSVLILHTITSASFGRFRLLQSIPI
jgi:hypothetical protein